MQIGMADEMAQIAANTTTRCAFHSVGKTNGGDQHEPAATVPLNGEGGDCDRIRQLVSVWEAKAQIGGSAPTAASDGLINGTLGSPSATLSIHGRTLPPTPPAFGGVIKESAKDSDAVVAAARRAAQGRAQRAAHHDRRPGLWRQQHVRRRNPDAGAG